MRTARGFSIIELIIAVGLGAILVYTAASAFRVASQAVTVADALSLDNAMMRAGYIEAHEQLDYWTALDNPDDPANQRLRANADAHWEDNDARGWCWTWNWQRIDPSGSWPNPPKIGLPFAPLKSVMPYHTTTVPRFSPGGKANGLVDDIQPRATPTTASASDPWEQDLGWDPSYAWAPHDPRTWYQGNMAEKIRWPHGWESKEPSLWFGRYALFGSVDAQPTLHTFSIAYEPLSSEMAHDVTYGGVTAPHEWYGRQLYGLSRAFGFYAFLDYAPTNSIYEWYGSNDWWTNDGGLHQRCNAPWWDFCNDDGNQLTGRGIYRESYATSFALIDPPASGDDTSLAHDSYKHFTTDYGASDTDPNSWNRKSFAEFQAKTAYSRDLVAVRPAHWPDVSISIGRFVKTGRFVQIVRIRRADPKNGEVAELSFAGTGTTLRGARLQRRPDQGWAEWDNADPSKNDPTLDSY